MKLPDPLTVVPTAPAKRRILDAADRLFYQEGIRAVGVDRLIAESTVTKATFYKHFGAKDRVAAAYVGNRHLHLAERLGKLVEQANDPRAALLAIRDDILADLDAPGFRGCPFLNAASEFADPAHPVRVAVRAHRDWYADSIETIVRANGHPLPGEATDDLVVARDGALAGGYAGDPIAAAGALERAFARVLRPA